MYLQGYWDPQEADEGPEASKTPDVEVITKTFKPLTGDAEESGLRVISKTIETLAGDTEEPETPAPRLQEPALTGEGDLSWRAIESFNAGDYETALSLFSELSKRNDRALFGLGLSYYKLGDYENAAYHLEEALAKGIKEFQTRKFLAFIYYDLDDLDASLSNAEAALRLRQDIDLSGLIGRLRREKPAQENFIKEETLHFKVLFDGYEHGSLSIPVLGILEDAYNTIGVNMNHFPDKPVTVILYTDKDFYVATNMPGWSGGIFDGKIRVPLKGIDQHGPEVLRKVLFHEYAHALIYSIMPNCPTWINEGLAMNLAGEHRDKVGQLIPLRGLESPFPQAYKQSEKAYRVSYSAVAYLIENYGIYRFKDLLVALSRGEDLEGAFNSVFYISYNEFVDTWGKN
jgi:tetratricopeptide (TPR) repeat protein